MGVRFPWKTIKIIMSNDIPPHSSDRSIFLAAKGGGIVFIGNLFSYGSQLVLGILLTRFLGAEQFGQYKVALIAGEVGVGIALLGMDYAMVRFVSLDISRSDTARIWGTLQIGIGITTCSSLLIGGGLFALAAPIATYIFHEPELVPIIHLSSLIVPFSTAASVLAAAIMGFNNMGYATFSRQIAQPLIRLILLVLLAIFGLTARNAIFPYIAGLIVTCVLLFYYLNRLFPLKRPLKMAQRNTREILRISLPAYFSALIDSFGPSLQTVILGSLNSITNAGIFSVAHQVSTASSLFNQSIGTASSPIISDLHGKGDRAQLAHFYQTTTKWMFTVNLPMFLIILLFSKPILAIFGSEFVQGSTILILLASANLIIASAGIADGVLAMTGHTPTRLVNSICLTVCMIGLSILLIPSYGAIGTAAASLSSALIVSLLRVFEVYFLEQLIPYNPGYIKPITAGLTALAIGWFTGRVLQLDSSLILAILNSLVILAAYAGVLLLLRFSNDDRKVFFHLRDRIVLSFSRRGEKG